MKRRSSSVEKKEKKTKNSRHEQGAQDKRSAESRLFFTSLFFQRIFFHLLSSKHIFQKRRLFFLFFILSSYIRSLSFLAAAARPLRTPRLFIWSSRASSSLLLSRSTPRNVKHLKTRGWARLKKWAKKEASPAVAYIYAHVYTYTICSSVRRVDGHRMPVGRRRACDGGGTTPSEGK